VDCRHSKVPRCRSRTIGDWFIFIYDHQHSKEFGPSCITCIIYIIDKIQGMVSFDIELLLQATLMACNAADPFVVLLLMALHMVSLLWYTKIV